MKSVVVILSGVADVPSDALSGRTALQAADKPAIDALARSGRVGAVQTVPAGQPPGSDVALLSLLGYDPAASPLRRGALEAVGADVAIGKDDLVLRGNLVTLDADAIVDLTAGRISTREATVLLADLCAALGDERVRIVPTQGYRFLLVIEGGRNLRVVAPPPHAALSRSVRAAYPSGEDGGQIGRILDRAAQVLAAHEVNRVRVDLGENPANFLWLWGAGGVGSLPSFTQEWGLSAACVAGAVLAIGVAKQAAIDLIAVEGATGDLDTDLAAKAAAAQAALETHDFVLVHVQGANEVSHLGDARAKAELITRIDRELIAPLAESLRARDNWRILIASDHPTATERDVLLPGRAPFLIAGTDIAAIRGYPFDEEHAAKSELQVEDGPSLMEFFLRGRPRRPG